MRKANNLQIILMNLYNLTIALFCSIMVILTPYLTYGAISYFIISVGTCFYNILDDIVEKDVLYSDYTRSYEIKTVLTNILLSFTSIILHDYFMLITIKLFNLIQK